MKLILTEYLASLKERGELDVIMPDLLSEIGFTVISRPSIGTKQYGVDVVAIGKDAKDVRCIYLISIKRGDLKRSGWDVGDQSLRTSLNQILDVYIPKLLPTRHKDLPVVVVICLGGDLHEGVRTDVEGYIDSHKGEQVSFEVWNGDMLAGMLLTGVLRENALPKTWRSDFRKSVALVDEPKVSFGHFCHFVVNIADTCKKTRPGRLTAIRQIYLGLWTLFVWAREADNTEAAYLCSEYAVLVGWSLMKDHISGTSKAARQLKQSIDRLIALHSLIADDYITRYVEPRAKILHGLTSAVPSHASLDVNLRLFDLVGRVGMRGLWQLHRLSCLDRSDNEQERELVREALQRTARLLTDMIQNNPILCAPIKDNQAIDINIACLFLGRLALTNVIQHWIGQITGTTVFAFRAHGQYPCIFDDYRDLVDHPRHDDAYRVEATAGSLLVPTLAVWAAITADSQSLGRLAEFASGLYSHSTLQLWYPGPDTEAHLYRGSANHGLAATGVEIQTACKDMLAPIRSECAATTTFSSLSAVECGIWPLVILASRCHRVPVAPHFWLLAVPFSDSAD